MTDRPLRIGLDVGGTKIDAVAVDQGGDVIARVRRASGRGSAGVIASVLDSVNALGSEASFGIDEVEAVGVGIPGRVDADAGRVLHAVNLDIESLDLASVATAQLGVPVRIDNDVNAAAVGAAALMGSTESMAYLNLGTGVAAGIVIDGRIWHGARSTAGEIGHLSVDPNGRLCGCGQVGCIETLCGGGALARAWGRPGALPVRDIFDAAENGEADAVALRADLFRGAAAAVRALVLTADVERVVFGGGLTALGDQLEGGVRAALRRDAEASAFMRSLRLDERIEMLPAGSSAGALGAALIAASGSLKEIVPHG